MRVYLGPLSRELLTMASQEGIIGIHHFNFTVEDLERTVAFYRDYLGFSLHSRALYTHTNEASRNLLGDLVPDIVKDGLESEIAVMDLNGLRVEFMQMFKPKTMPYHGNITTAGSAHLAIRVKDIAEVRARLEKGGVEFATPIMPFAESGFRPWEYCTLRDPNGIYVELIQEQAVTTMVETLGLRIREVRSARGLTLKHVAEASEKVLRT